MSMPSVDELTEIFTSVPLRTFFLDMLQDNGHKPSDEWFVNAAVVLCIFEEEPDVRIERVAAFFMAETATTLSEFTAMMARLTRHGYCNLSINDGERRLSLSAKGKTVAAGMKTFLTPTDNTHNTGD